MEHNLYSAIQEHTSILYNLKFHYIHYDTPIQSTPILFV